MQRALMGHDMADLYGKSRIPLYVMNVAYPVIDSELQRFCAGKKAVLVVEEGQPDYHEQAIHAVLGRAGIRTVVHGKDMLARAGEYTVAELKRGLAVFLEEVPPRSVGQGSAPRHANAQGRRSRGHQRRAISGARAASRASAGDFGPPPPPLPLRPCALPPPSWQRWCQPGRRVFASVARSGRSSRP